MTFSLKTCFKQRNLNYMKQSPIGVVSKGPLFVPYYYILQYDTCSAHLKLSSLVLCPVRSQQSRKQVFSRRGFYISCHLLPGKVHFNINKSTLLTILLAVTAFVTISDIIRIYQCHFLDYTKNRFFSNWEPVSLSPYV